MVVQRYYRTDDETPIKHGAWLAVCDSAKTAAIISGQARNDQSAYGPSDTLRVASASGSSIAIDCSISNLGEADSDDGRLAFVFWGEGGRTGVYKHPLAVPVPAGRAEGSAGLTRTQVDILLANVETPAALPPFTDVSQISHIYCVAYDVLRDPLDAPRLDLYRAAKGGQKITGENPLRTSAAIGCCKLGSTFSLNGNTLTLAHETYVEMMLTFVDAGADSGFGQSVQGAAESWIGSLKNTARNVLLPPKKLMPRGEGVFALLSTLGTRLSNNSSYCQISLDPQQSTVGLKFEDGGGGAYDDYHLKVFEF